MSVKPECTHERSVTTDMTKFGVLAEVTACADCGHPLDYRKLREKDVSGSDVDLPVHEADIQAAARVAKAREVLEESGEALALPAEPTGPSGPSGPLGATGLVRCTKQGGSLVECDTGPSRAQHCAHSKWGELRTFNGPCRCECHRA